MDSVFTASSSAIPDSVQTEMRGRSWHVDAECPPFSELRLLVLAHHGFDGRVHHGELVVHREVAPEVTRIFQRLFALGFAIESMRRVDHFDGSDDASMAA